jgi:hypothetical protein
VLFHHKHILEASPACFVDVCFCLCVCVCVCACSVQKYGFFYRILEAIISSNDAIASLYHEVIHLMKYTCLQLPATCPLIFSMAFALNHCYTHARGWGSVNGSFPNMSSFFSRVCRCFVCLCCAVCVVFMDALLVHVHINMHACMHT